MFIFSHRYFDIKYLLLENLYKDCQDLKSQMANVELQVFWLSIARQLIRNPDIL